MYLLRIHDKSRVEDLRQPFGDNICVGVTLGNFEGMHRGHQALFGELHTELQRVAEKRSERPVSVLLTFFPHPREVLERGSASTNGMRFDRRRLTSFRRKSELCEDFGFDCFSAIRFSRKFAGLSAEDFVQRYIVGVLQARLVVVGYDWSFGRGRAGTAELLEKLAAKNGFESLVVGPVRNENGERISSSLVRKALSEGDLRLVRDCLGRDFEVSDWVRHGEKRGSELGYPTANLEFQDQMLPADGVYATMARVEEREVQSVTNIGFRPTFGGEDRIVEVHLLDAEGVRLYGRRLHVRFVERLRDEKRFLGASELKGQIERDIELAREVLRSQTVKNPS